MRFNSRTLAGKAGSFREGNGTHWSRFVGPPPPTEIGGFSLEQVRGLGHFGFSILGFGFWIEDQTQDEFLHLVSSDPGFLIEEHLSIHIRKPIRRRAFNPKSKIQNDPSRQPL